MFKTLDDERAISRQRRCACGGRWYTDERVRKGSFLVIAEPLVTTGSSSKLSGSGLKSVSDQTQAPSEPPDQTPARVSKPPVFVGLPLAAKGESWDVPADLDAELEAAFPSINRASEYQKAKVWLIATPAKRKTAGGMARFLLHWFTKVQDSGRASGPDLRCHFHRSPGTSGKRPPSGYFAACPECKHARAGGGTRTGEPTTIADLAAETARRLAAKDAGVVPATREELEGLRQRS